MAAAAGADHEVVTGDQRAGEAQQATGTILGFLGNPLLVFAGVSLLVGAFLINNTFAIVVAQRSRELALLRAVGASRAQVLASVLLEALVVGMFASAVGVGVGVLVAAALLRAVGATRRQVRSIVRWESVLIAVLGAVFGITVGSVFGWMSVQALADQGVSTFAFPVVQITLAVVAAAVAGTLAAVMAARRAARVDVLRALAAS